MKKFLLCVVLLMTFCRIGFAENKTSISGRGSSWVNDHLVFGILSYCNANESEVRKLVTSRLIYNRLLQDCGYVEFNVDENFDIRLDDLNEDYVTAFRDSMRIKFYDTLNSMIMALKSGEVNAIFVHNVVADYLCAKDSELYYINKFVAGENINSGLLSRLVKNGFHSDEFAFMMMKGNEKIRDEFNKAIIHMEAEGVLHRLEAQLKETEPIPVELTKIDGADTIKVGVTGDLPPFDYISATGVPAGYNTAVLAEIGRRIGKNIKLVNIDAAGRVIALSSGKVDVVFWNRSQAIYTEDGRYVFGEDEMRREIKALGMDSNKTDKALKLIEAVFTFDESVKMDQPDDVITTRPYYSSIITNVQKKK